MFQRRGGFATAVLSVLTLLAETSLALSQSNQVQWTPQLTVAAASALAKPNYSSCTCIETSDPYYPTSGIFALGLVTARITNHCTRPVSVVGMVASHYRNEPLGAPAPGRRYTAFPLPSGRTVVLEKEAAPTAYARVADCPAENEKAIVVNGGANGLTPAEKPPIGHPLVGTDVAPDFSQNYRSLVHVTGNGELQGTGFLITQTGYILTAAHLVKGANQGRARARMIGSQNWIDTEVIKVAGMFDAALIKIPGGPYRPVTLASPLDSTAGAPVRTLGFRDESEAPETTNGTVTVSCIPMKRWEMSNRVDGGDSGAPVFSTMYPDPKVVGLVTSKSWEGNHFYFVPLTVIADLLGAAGVPLPKNISVPRPGSIDPCDGRPY